MNPIQTYQGIIYPWHCDHMGHMNVQYYVAMFDQATWSLMSQLGMTSQYIQNNKVGMVALEQHIKYLKELLPGNSIRIETEIIEIKDKTIRFKHVMINTETEEIASEAVMLGLHIDRAIRKSKKLPTFVAEKFNSWN